ncbi:unnamed protein product [Dovyalis caffra]|uniref:Receptor-like serine/threonine-protein kinase n=1 Tax=Dovyalis caffra TaxID=77055 RepID=A0AAV1RRB6_9ROSI|nr:unnamed protein product [Dovyalis caffra]
MILAIASAIFNPKFLVTIVLLEFVAAAQSSGSVPVGASITATDNAPSWPSSSRDFAFGFHQLKDKDHFLLSIWYDKIPETTIVWYANGDNPAPRGSKVELTTDLGLVLTDPQGNQIWNSGIKPGAVSSGVMNDTGNFVLQNSNSDRLWESFDHPSDTLLPTQIMEIEGVLSSRRSETNFSLGRFQFRFDAGALVLNSINLPTGFAYDSYYRTPSDDSDSSNSGYRLIFNESGYMYMSRRNGQRFSLTDRAVPTADFYHRATLNFDGVFTQYFYPKTSGSNRSWSSVWSKPDNICVDIGGGLGSGACGYNSICSLNDDKRPDCNCPKNFSLLDENDRYGSCIPDFELSCKDRLNSTEDQYDFQELINIDWPTSDYERSKPSDEDTCRKSCLNDCLCAVAIFRDGCWKKKLPLSNGRFDSRMNGKALIKFPKGYVPWERPPLQLPEEKKNRDVKFITGSVLLGSSVFVNFVFVGAFCLTSSFIYRKKTKKIEEGRDAVETNLRCFTYEELAAATNDFKDELGRGGFGAVYKGTIPVGSTNVVAVKKLNKMVQDGEKEFKTEVRVIGQIHHKNLVRLLGYCDEGQNRLLVNTPITAKVDVYSFGVMLLEIICCRRSVDLEIGEKAVLTDWAYDCYANGTLDALLEDDMEAMNDISTVEKLLKVAFWCIHEEPSRRPIMRKVTQMLEGVVEVLAPPNPFPFSTISNDL